MPGPLFDRGGGTGAAARRCASAAAPGHDLLIHAVRVDHADRSSAFPVKPRRPVLLHVDGDVALPLLALDAGGRPLARFRYLGDLAWFLHDGSTAAPTLPYPIVVAHRRDLVEQRALL